MNTPISMIGLDIGRKSAVACLMKEPPIDLIDFIRRYKPIAVIASEEGLQKILELGDYFGLEPTGTDHRWWKQKLEEHGKTVLLCSGVRIRNHARDHGITSKGDKEDAATIASFLHTNLNKGNLKAFQANVGNEIQDLRRGLLSCQNHRTRIICQLKSRLSFEAPDLCKIRITERKWGRNSPVLWNEMLSNESLSWLSREDVEQIIYWNQREQRIELELSKLLEQPEYQVYVQKLSTWEFSERLLIPIIGAVYPIEQFLDENGNRIIERQYTTNGNRTKLDRSLRGIHRSLGYGRIKIQSGDSWRWARTGDRTILSALYLWVEMMVSIRRTPRGARLIKLYEAPENFDKLNAKKRKAWIEEHNFRAFCIETEPKCGSIQPIPRDRQRVGYMPWKDEALIQAVCNYSLTNARIAQLQLFYEFGFFEINQHERVLKTLPYFIKLIAQDLLK